MKQNVKLILWGLVPLPVGYLVNLLLGYGVMLYPLVDLAFLAAWGILAYELCAREKPVLTQAAALCAVGGVMLVLSWVNMYGPEWSWDFTWWTSFYFCPALLLLSGIVGGTFYEMMGEGYTLLPVHCVLFALYFVIALVGMWLKKRKA